MVGFTMLKERSGGRTGFLNSLTAAAVKRAMFTADRITFSRQQGIIPVSLNTVKPWLGIDQGLGIGVQRVVDDLVGGAGFHKAAPVDDRYAVTEVAGSGNRMGDKQDGNPHFPADFQ